MQALRDLAKDLLTRGEVAVVIGWEEGPRGVRPAFVTRPEDADRLVFDARCVQNLATYLNPRRTQIDAMGKPAVCVKGCDARAVAGLVRESQIKRDDVVLIGLRCSGVRLEADGPACAKPGELSPRCAGCDALETGRHGPRGRRDGPPRRGPRLRRAPRRAGGHAPGEALGLLAGGLCPLHAVQRLPPGLPHVFLRAVRPGQDPAPVDREFAPPPGQHGVALHAGHPPGGALLRVRRVRACLPRGHPAHAPQPEGGPDGGSAVRLQGLGRPRGPLSRGHLPDQTTDRSSSDEPGLHHHRRPARRARPRPDGFGSRGPRSRGRIRRRHGVPCREELEGRHAPAGPFPCAP